MVEEAFCLFEQIPPHMSTHETDKIHIDVSSSGLMRRHFRFNLSLSPSSLLFSCSFLDYSLLYSFTLFILSYTNMVMSTQVKNSRGKIIPHSNLRRPQHSEGHYRKLHNNSSSAGVVACSNNSGLNANLNTPLSAF